MPPIAYLCAVAIALVSCPPAAQAASTPLPVYASLTLNVSTGSDWTTISLIGGLVVDSHITVSTGGATVGMGTNGISVGNPHPSVLNGSNSLPPAQAIVNLVYSFSLGQQVTVQICKGNLGSVSAEVSRNEGSDHTSVASQTDSTTGQAPGADGCQNESDSQVGQSTLSGPSGWPPLLDPNHHVLAAYYPWYDSSTFQSGSWAETPLTPFDTSDPTSVGEQIDEARAQHIDGFVVSYDGNATYAQRLSLVTQEAATRPGFSVAPMIEMDQIGSSATAIESAINDALSRTSGPNQLQVSGRPVVFVFDAQLASAASWQAVRVALSQQDPLLIADTEDPSYKFDGLFNYTSNFAADNQIAGLDRGYEQAARWDSAVNPAEGSQRLWVAPVSPGEDSCITGHPGDYVYVDRESGARYDYAWQAAYASEPEWIFISTWNEWYEDTAIAPGSVSGSQALSQTGPYAQSFETTPTSLPSSSYPAPGSANSSQSCP